MSEPKSEYKKELTSVEEQRDLMAHILDATARELSSFEKHLLENCPDLKKQIKETYKKCREVIKDYKKNNHYYTKSAKGQ